MKRKSILFLVLLLVMNTFNISYSKSPDIKTQAYAILSSENPECVNLQPSMSIVPKVQRQGGKQGWLLSPDVVDASARDLNFNVNDKYIYNLKDYQTVRVDVEYYDSGNGTIVILYNNYEGKLSQTNYTTPHYTNEWRTESFYISDCAFTNLKDNLYDFSVSVYSSKMGTSLGDVLIGRVSVTPLEQKEHILISPENSSEMSRFYTGDNIELKFVFSNDERSGSSDGCYDADVVYEVFSSNGEKIYKTDEKISFSYGSTVGKKLEFDLTRYDLYDVVISAKNEDLGLWGKTKFTFGYINSVKGKYLNYRSSIIGEPTRENIEVFTNAGIGNVRATAPGTRDFHIMNNEYRVAPKYREQIRMYQQAGIDIVVCLMNYGKQLPFKTGEKTPISDAAMAEWAAFCKTVVEDMKGITNVFELWNEYDITGGAFNPDSGTPEDYARLAKVTYKAIKEVNPAAQLITMSTSGGSSGFPSVNFIDLAFKAGISKYSDGVAIHPYYWYDSPKKGNVYEVILNGVRRLMDENGMEGKPLYATEVGWATNYYNVTDKTQGYFTVQNYVINSQKHNNKPLVDVISVYTMYDKSNYIRNDRESNFGIMHKDTPKPAYLMLANMNVLLADSECINAMSLNDDTTYVYYFDSQKRRNTNTLVMWTENATDTVRLNLGVEEVSLYDSYGNKKNVKGNNGKFTFTLTNQPIYAEGDFVSVNETKSGSAVEIDKAYFTTSQENIFSVDFKSNEKGIFNINADIGNAPLEIIENNPVSNGKGSIVFKTGKALNGEEKISFTISNDKGTYLYSDAVVKFSNPLELYLSKKFNTSDKQWYLVGTVKNNSTKDISGVFGITSPKEFSDGKNESENTVVGAGEEKKIELKLPVQSSSEQIPLSASFIKKDGGGADANMNLSFDTVLYADDSITIDGKLNENVWNKTSGFVLNSRNQFFDEVTLAGDYKGPADISAVIKILWDEEKLYIATCVTDDIHSQKGPAASLWKYDSLQIGASYDPKNELSSLDFYEIAIGLLDDGTPSLQRYENGMAVSYDLDKVEVGIIRDEEKKTTTYEAAFLWNELSKNLDAVESDTEFKFSMLVNDADEITRKGYYEFGSGMANGKNSSLFKTLNLVKQ